MPKNNKSLMGREQWREYDCPCGYSYTSNDKKGLQTIIRIHKKVCETAKQCIIRETHINRTTYDDAGTFKQRVVKSEVINRF